MRVSVTSTGMKVSMSLSKLNSRSALFSPPASMPVGAAKAS